MPNDLVLASGQSLVRACTRPASWLPRAPASTAQVAASVDSGQLMLDLGEAFAPSVAERARRRRATGAGRSRKPSSAGAPTWSTTSKALSPTLLVLDFHVALGLPWAATPNVAEVPDGLVQLRIALLEEEVAEFARAAQARDLVGIADALADIAYVTYGAAVTFGIDLDAVIAEVHRSNMSKLDEHGRPVLRADGKVLKSSRYRPPDVAAVLARARALTQRPK